MQIIIFFTRQYHKVLQVLAYNFIKLPDKNYPKDILPSLFLSKIEMTLLTNGF